MNNSNAILEINNKHLAYNFRLLSKLVSRTVCGATIKADAYGTGVINAFNILYKNQCRHFFFATLNEAINIRKKYSKANIYVLNGLENNKIAIFHKLKIIPILNSLEELNILIKEKNKKNLKFGIHIETGLNRLGININELKLLDISNLKLTILISHLSSAEEKNNQYNEIQNKKFISTFNFFKSVAYKSLSNSAGTVLKKNIHYDLVRPGISLYGGYINKTIHRALPIKPVIRFKAKVLQIKNIKKNQYVGYNQTYKTKSETNIAIIGAGYADGISRKLSNKGYAYYKNKRFKIIGRVSMDSITIDIGKNNQIIKSGMYIDLINEKNDIEKMAKICNTISHEILTSISKRVERVYI